MQFDTKRFIGGVERVIAVTTNDPANPLVNLRLKAVVVGSASILPAAQLILPSPTNLARSARLLVRQDPTESGTLEVAKIATSAPWLSATARKVVAPEPGTSALPVSALLGDWVLELSLAADAPLGKSDQWVAFATGLPREESITVPVRVQLADVMDLRPPILDLHIAAGEREARGLLTVTIRPDVVAEKLQVKVPPGPFQVVVERPVERRYKLTVTWKADETTAPVFDTELTLTLGSATTTVPVRVHRPS